MLVDVAIMTALSMEREAVIAAFECDDCVSKERFETDTAELYLIYLMRSAAHPDRPQLRVAICPSTGMGPIKAAVKTAQMLHDLSPTVTILVGIAGCMTPELGTGVRPTLGDVAICTGFHDILLGKQNDGKLDPEWTPYQCDNTLVRDIEDWCYVQPWFASVTMPRPDSSETVPKAILGHFVSGNYVLADNKTKTKLKSKVPNRRLLAIEMEASGVKAVLESHPANNSFLMIKGLSDWATGADKNNTNPKKDVWHFYASHAAAIFTRKMLVNGLWQRIQRYKIPADPTVTLERSATGALNCFLGSYGKTAPFVVKTARILLDEMVREVTALAREPLKDGEYRAKLDHGHQFLLRAKEVFGNAFKVDAFSVDVISTFWQSRTFKSQVKQYIDNQAGGLVPNNNVTRIFVFSTPEEAHKYSRILDYHAERYPNTFICSREHYEKHVAATLTMDSASAKEWSQRDFAILEYSDRPATKFLAFLEGETLVVSPIVSEYVHDLVIPRAIDLFSRLKKIEESSVMSLQNAGFLRWKKGFWERKQEWAEALGLMFEQVTADVFHIAGFSAGRAQGYFQLRQAIAQMKMDINGGNDRQGSLATKFGIKGAWMGSKIEYQEGARPRDKISQGQLQYKAVGLPKDIVVMRFDDSAAMDAWLGDGDHAALRFAILNDIATTDTTLKKVMDDFNVHSADELRALCRRDPELARRAYEAIEATGAIWRVDLRDDEVLDVLVNTEPPTF